ncbi:MAG: peptidase S8 [Nitrosarchaeum sp.]|nr:MAG: peptidase S8 [Nitrosarchaeum sp.]
MKLEIIFTIIITISASLIILESESNEIIHTYLDKSVPFVGGDIPRIEGIEGNGIKIAVIDTGVDFNHPDLLGWGSDGKVVGGYNFIQEGKPPLDTNGHGTQVAGVIAADGQLKGIAPKAKILAYKVSENGEGVSSDLIIKAIDKAIEDDVDIINISLGLNKTNTNIENAVNRAVAKKIFVVTAAGNDGPTLQTIGSPGKNHGSITVGATYNNLTSSLVATLEINKKPYTVVPMVGSSKLNDPITSKIIFGGYGKKNELAKINATDSILLVERGSDVKGELLYFSIKEKNAVDAGAKAMIVYNNQPGIFLGELLHEFIESDYKPQIPVVSMDRKDGLEIRDQIQEKNKANLHLFYNPDFVAHFSSRGSVSPFYIKPDLVAPGVYLNTTQINGGYNFTSGTSFAAPHVSGAIVLLLEKYPSLHFDEIKALLMTTTAPVSDAYGKKFSLSDSGSGRLDIGKAFQAKLIITPPNFVINLSSDYPSTEKQLKLNLLEGTLEKIQVEFEGSEFIKFSYILNENNLIVKIKMLEQNYGDYEGIINIKHSEVNYVIPILIHYTEGSISVNQKDGKINFVIDHPKQWNFAKISVINSESGKTNTITTTPEKNASIKVNENLEYWIAAKIQVDGESFDAYNTIKVNSVNQNNNELELPNIPEKQIEIVLGIILVIGIIGIISKKNTIKEKL